MTIYEPSESHDILLIHWWADMCRTGEIDRIFVQGARSFVSFLTCFVPPRTLIFEHDDDGIWLAAWFDPIMSGAFMGFWIAARKRRTREAYKSTMFIYEHALEQWPVLMGVSGQENLLDIHENMGYTFLGKIPHLWDGREAYVFHLTKEGFRGRRRRR